MQKRKLISTTLVVLMVTFIVVIIVSLFTTKQLQAGGAGEDTPSSISSEPVTQGGEATSTTTVVSEAPLPERVAGRYHNQDDFDEYIELKADGTAYWREKSDFGSQYNTQVAVKWKAEGEEIVFVVPLGTVVSEAPLSEPVAGRYHNQDDFEEYIELKADGTAYWREKALFASQFTELPQYTELAAKWKAEGEEIVFVGPLGVVVRGKISPNTILADGKVWVRKGEIKKTSEKSLKDRIPGKYIAVEEPDEEVVAEVIFRKDGTIVSTSSGTWDLLGTYITFYPDDGEVERWQIRDETLRCLEGTYMKQEGAKAVKDQIVGVRKITLWSDYLLSELSGSLANDYESFQLRFNKDGSFSFIGLHLMSWGIEDGVIHIYERGRKFAARIEGHTIILEQAASGLRFVRQEEKTNGGSKQQERSTKQQLVDALEDLKRAIIKKVHLEVDVTVQCFTSVKEYRRAKLLADVLRPVLRVIQGTLSAVSKIGDAKTLSGQVKSSLDNAQYVSEASSLFFMINGLREAGEKLYYALDDTAGYAQSVKDMLDAADQTTVVRMDPAAYKQVIKQYVDGIEGTPLVITRTSSLAPDRKPVQGGFMLQKIIREEFKRLIDQIQRGELPQNFPLKDLVADVEHLKDQILEAGVHNTDVRYNTYHRDGKLQQSRKLGAIAEHNKAFSAVSTALAKRQELEIYAECAQLAASAADAAYIVTYNVPGTGDSAKVAQQISLLPQIVIEGQKMFTVDPQEQFYQMPQEMVFSLAIEFSNLWRISDDVVFSLSKLLEGTGSRSTGGIKSIKGEDLMWVMCQNPNCKSAYQIDKKDYYTQIDEKMRANPMSIQTPALTCQKCGQNSVYRAVKRPKCGHMFFYGKRGDFDDRCPECGFSKMEDERKKARERRRHG